MSCISLIIMAARAVCIYSSYVFFHFQKLLKKSAIEGGQPDDESSTNVKTVEAVVHKRDEEEKDKALEVRVEDKKTVSEKATDDGIYLHESNQLKLRDQCIESVSVKHGELKGIRYRVCFDDGEKILLSKSSASLVKRAPPSLPKM